MEFTTAIGKLSIQETIIRQKRIVERRWEKKIIKLVAPVFIFYGTLNRFVVPNFENYKTGKKVAIIMFFAFILLGMLISVYEFIFQKHWGNKLSIQAINKINTTNGRNELETKVEITLKSKRKKSYYFRTLENQHGRFIAALQAINPDIKIFEKGNEITTSLN